jgi:hypothetical protein
MVEQNIYFCLPERSAATPFPNQTFEREVEVEPPCGRLSPAGEIPSEVEGAPIPRIFLLFILHQGVLTIPRVRFLKIHHHGFLGCDGKAAPVATF